MAAADPTQTHIHAGRSLQHWLHCVRLCSILALLLCINRYMGGVEAAHIAGLSADVSAWDSSALQVQCRTTCCSVTGGRGAAQVHATTCNCLFSSLV